MGNTFGNMQLLNQNFNKDFILEKIQLGLKEKGYELNEKGSLKFKIFYQPSNKWICIQSNALEHVNHHDLKKLSELFYHLFQSDVISLNIFDSDILSMSLYGINQDIYIDDNNMYDLAIPGTIDKWIHLINEHYTKEDLQTIWDNHMFIYMDEKLSKIGKILGFNDLCQNGYHDLIETNKDYDIINLSFECRHHTPYININ